jgi:hypothetical protein
MMGSTYDADGKCTVPVKWAKHPYGELIAQISHFMDAHHTSQVQDFFQ